MSKMVPIKLDSEFLRWLPVVVFMLVGFLHSIILEPHQNEISTQSRVMSGLVFLIASILTGVALRKIKTLLGKIVSLMLIAMYFLMLFKVAL